MGAYHRRGVLHVWTTSIYLRPTDHTYSREELGPFVRCVSIDTFCPASQLACFQQRHIHTYTKYTIIPQTNSAMVPIHKYEYFVQHQQPGRSPSRYDMLSSSRCGFLQSSLPTQREHSPMPLPVLVCIWHAPARGKSPTIKVTQIHPGRYCPFRTAQYLVFASTNVASGWRVLTPTLLYMQYFNTLSAIREEVPYHLSMKGNMPKLARAVDHTSPYESGVRKKTNIHASEVWREEPTERGEASGRTGDWLHHSQKTKYITVAWLNTTARKPSILLQHGWTFYYVLLPT